LQKVFKVKKIRFVDIFRFVSQSKVETGLFPPIGLSPDRFSDKANKGSRKESILALIPKQFSFPVNFQPNPKLLPFIVNQDIMRKRSRHPKNLSNPKLPTEGRRLACLQGAMQGAAH